MKQDDGAKSIRLDKKDRQLLFELDMNARASLSELAKMVGLSKQSIGYRIERLRSLGVLEGFYTVLNLPKLGVMYTRLFIELRDVRPEIEKAIIGYASSHKEFGWIIRTEGRWDFVLVIFARDITEIKETVNDFVLTYGASLKSYTVSVATAIYHFQHKYLRTERANREVVMSGRLERPTMDELDKKILRIIASEARMSLKDIGNTVGVSYKVAAYHLKRLEKEGIILAYRSSVDSEKLGNTHYKVLLALQSATSKRLEELKSFLRFHQNVIYITEALSLSDIEFEAISSSLHEFYQLINELRVGFSDIIMDYDTIIAVKFYRITYLPEI